MFTPITNVFAICLLCVFLLVNTGTARLVPYQSLQVEKNEIQVDVIKTRSEVFPFKVDLEVVGQKIQLNLSKPKSSIFTEGFTFGTATVYQNTLADVEKDIFVDVNARAVVRVTADSKGSSKIEGFVNGIGITFDETSGRHFSTRRLMSNDISTFCDVIEADHQNSTVNVDAAQNFKSTNAKAVLEVQAVLDDTLARLFQYEQSAITFYCAVFFHAVNVVFESMENPSLKLKLAGVRVLTTEENQLIVEDTNHIIGSMLGRIRTWGNSQPSGLGPSDVVALLTGINALGNDGSSGVVGVAYVSATCTSNKYSVSEDGGGYYGGVFTVAHELGHNMGAQHDWDTPCGDEGYVMGGRGSPNHYYFSECSKTAIRDRINTSGGSCLLRDDAGTGVGLGDVDPGHLMTFDTQCRVRIEKGNYGTHLPYQVSDNPPHLACVQLKCRFKKKDSDAIWLVAFNPSLEGTSCNQSGGRCRKGVCI